MSLKIIIIGAGPSGLGAAYRLFRLRHDDFMVFEQNPYTGGLCASFTDAAGFVWDIGGHVTYCSQEETRQFFEKTLGYKWVHHLRESFIRILDRWIPYPFQNNIRHLPQDILKECLEGLIEAESRKLSHSNFMEWIIAKFGQGIAKYFMFPYNRKIWPCPLESISCVWADKVVNMADSKKIISNTSEKIDETDFGCNYKFRYPLTGGTGAIFRHVEPLLGDKLVLNKKAIGVDPVNRLLYLADNSSIKYDYLINTSPLPRFVTYLDNRYEKIKTAATALIANKMTAIGLGINRPADVAKSWMYFPEAEYPFYRVTNSSGYSPNNVPDSKNNFSLLAEISSHSFQAQSKDALLEQTIQGLIHCGLMKNDDRNKIISRFFHSVEYGYPVPTLQRDEALSYIMTELEQLNIFSIGLLGAWKYENASMEDSILQGMKTINKILNPDKDRIELW